MKVENSVNNANLQQKNQNNSKNQQFPYVRMNNQDVYMGYPEKSRQNIYIGADSSNINTEKVFNDVNTKSANNIYEGYPDKSRFASNSSDYEKSSSTNVHYSYPRQKRGSVYTGSDFINSNNISKVDTSSSLQDRKPLNDTTQKSNSTYNNDNLNQNSNLTKDIYDVQKQKVKKNTINKKLIFTLNLTVIAFVLIIVAPSFTLFASVPAIVLALFAIVSNDDRYFISKLCLVSSAIFSIISIVQFVL